MLSLSGRCRWTRNQRSPINLTPMSTTKPRSLNGRAKPNNDIGKLAPNTKWAFEAIKPIDRMDPAMINFLLSIRSPY